MIVSVASGKGGTGKTTVAVALATSIRGVQLLDCDVEEPNAHILLSPDIKSRVPVSVPKPVIDESRCTFCGTCQDICAYNALAVLRDKVLMFPELCHGCGACVYVCPEQAIGECAHTTGTVEIGEKQDIQFVQGRLDVGEASASWVIRAVRAYANPSRTVIVDAPPGTGCALVASVRKTDFCILVTEPTPFGLHDLRLAVDVMRLLEICHGVVINRSDLGNRDVERYCRSEDIPVLMRIPFRKDVAAAYAEGVSMTEVIPAYRNRFLGLFEQIGCSV